MCTPEAKDSPVPLENLLGERITHIKYRDEALAKITDDFIKAKSAARTLEKEWKGKTIYKIKADVKPKS